MAAVDYKVWARMWAHAWLEPDFRETLKTNPAAAAREFHDQFGLGPYDKIVDTQPIFDDPFTNGPLMNKSLSNVSPEQLEEIAATGKLDGKPFCMQPSEWMPLEYEKQKP